MAQRTLRLLSPSIEAQQSKHVVKGVHASLELFLVIWIWAAEDLLVGITQTRVSVHLTHPNLHVLVKHQVHSKDLKVPVGNDLILVVSLDALSNVCGSVCSNVQDLLPKIVLAERRVRLSQVRNQLVHSDLLTTPHNWLLVEVVFLIFWLGVQAHVCDMRRRIEESTKCLARESVRFGGEEDLTVFLNEGLQG